MVAGSYQKENSLWSGLWGVLKFVFFKGFQKAFALLRGEKKRAQYRYSTSCWSFRCLYFLCKVFLSDFFFCICICGVGTLFSVMYMYVCTLLAFTAPSLTSQELCLTFSTAKMSKTNWLGPICYSWILQNRVHLCQLGMKHAHQCSDRF